ncbi:MAG: nucleotidyltransferase [Proteobacteria bacterium]|nr:nucleotidyltransferase [Pseudomonadota bacterium]
MGSSGEGHWGGKPGTLADKIRQAGTDLDSAEYEAAVASLLGDALSNLNERDTEAVASHLETIKKALEKDVEGTLDLLFGGSVAKNTYADGISDVDAMVILDGSELAGKSPEEVCQYLLTRMRERLPNTVVERDGFAIRIEYADATIELIPVLREGGSLKISNASCTGWASISPERFSRKLTEVNQACSGKAVPTIKVVKQIFSSVPENQRPSGYHIEALAVDAFQGYTGPRTTKAMVEHFFTVSAEAIKAPMTDTTGQSAAVDDYLGKQGSVERMLVANAMARIARRIRVADGAQSVDHWKELLGSD